MDVSQLTFLTNLGITSFLDRLWDKKTHVLTCKHTELVSFTDLTFNTILFIFLLIEEF